MTLTPFEPKGSISQRAALVQIIQALEPGQWLSWADAAYRTGELVGYVITEEQAQAAFWSANQTLAGDEKVPARSYMGGIKRMTVGEQIKDVVDRGRHIRKKQRRHNQFASAALANDQLDGRDRVMVENLRNNTLRQLQIAERRAARFRPEAPEIEG